MMKCSVAKCYRRWSRNLSLGFRGLISVFSIVGSVKGKCFFLRDFIERNCPSADVLLYNLLE